MRSRAAGSRPRYAPPMDLHPRILHHERGGSGPRVVLVHGFTQTRTSWSEIAAALRARHEVVAVDLPGHGGSSSLRLSLPETAAALAATGGPAVYVGYSLGGRVCLRLAVDRPDLTRGLVLLGATPGIEDPAERAARRATDETRAAELERDGVPAFLDRWLRLPLFATLPATAAGRADRETNTAEGLAASLRLAGTGTQEPLWDRLPGITAPTLLLAGDRDEKFGALATRMAGRIGPNAEAARIPDAGHAAHLEQPTAVTGLLRQFLARTART